MCTLKTTMSDENNSIFFKLSLILYWLLTYHSSLAQFAVSGRVLNQADKKSIIGASVFLSNATIGTITETDGSFILSKIKPGQYELVISSIGFNTFHKPINIVSSSLDLGNIEVSVKTTVLKDVVIRSTADLEWKKYYDWFKDGFLGHSGLEKECRIRNPDILNFNYRENGDSLIASSEDFLIIENKALGYNVKYLLNNFVRTDSGRSVHYEGSVLFEKMRGTASQQLRWKKKRVNVYEGSLMHFLRSAISDRLYGEGFRVFQYSIHSNPDRPPDSLIDFNISRYKKLKSKNSRFNDSLSFWIKKSRLPKVFHSLMNFALNNAEIFKLTDQKGMFALGCEDDGLFITYNKIHHFPKNDDLAFLNSPYNSNNTLVLFNSPFAIFDNNGWLLDPAQLTFNGAWGTGRAAALLPVDYQLPK